METIIGVSAEEMDYIETLNIRKKDDREKMFNFLIETENAESIIEDWEASGAYSNSCPVTFICSKRMGKPGQTAIKTASINASALNKLLYKN